MDDKEPNFQMTFAFIDRQIENNVIQQRLLDGYINATALCQAAQKRMYDYLRLENTKAFISALESKTGIPASALIQSVKGGLPELQGTWVHPYVAVNLAQWANPEVAVITHCKSGNIEKCYIAHIHGVGGVYMKNIR